MPPVRLSGLIGSKFSQGEIEALCADLGVDFENLSGSNKSGKARSLVDHMQNRVRTDQLLAVMTTHRPELDLRPYFHLLLIEHFDAAGVQQLARNLGLDIQAEKLTDRDLGFDQPGNKFMKQKRLLALQESMEKNGRFGDLVRGMAALKPDVDLSLFLDIEEGQEPEQIPPANGGGQPTNVGNGVTAVPDYETLELRLGLRRADGSYELSAETNQGGESGSFVQKLPLDDDDFTDLIDYLRDLVAEPDEAVQFGEKIRDFLFPTKVWNFYTNRLAAARETGKKGIRIQLRIDLKSPELSQIPWEYCRDQKNSYITLNPKTTFVRYIPTDARPEPISVPDKVRILIAMASPEGEGYAPLKVGEEDDRIRAALETLKVKGKVEIRTLEHTTRLSLFEAFGDFNPHILHFTGHGILQENGIGALVLETDEKKPDHVDAGELMEVLRVNESMKLVILSACETAAHGTESAIMGVAPRLVTDGLPAAIAMQFAVPEKTALQFMKNLYKSLAQNDPLDTAVAKARIGARFVDPDTIYWAIPVLFMRAPNGNIWQ